MELCLPTWIIIPVSPRKDLTDRCLTSIFQSDARNFRLHLSMSHFDGLPSKWNHAIDRQTWPDKADAPFNFARTVNMACAEHPDNDVVLLNNDCVCTPGWLDRLQEAAQSIGGVVSARTTAGGCGNIDLWGHPTEDHGILKTRRPINLFCAYLPVRVRKCVGPLDESFDAYGGEDCDYSLRALKHLFPLLASRAYVHHRARESFGDKNGSIPEPLVKRGLDRFDRKWPGVNPYGPYSAEEITPTVSVALAVGPVKTWFQDAANSIKNQTLACELVCMHDRHEQGAAKTKNEVAAMCRGEFLAFQDADDISASERIERQLARFREDPALDILYTNAWETRADLSNQRPFRTGPWDVGQFLDQKFWVAGATILMRRYVWDAVGPFDTNYPHSHDYEWMLRAHVRGMNIGYLNEPLYTYRRHDGNTSGGMETKHEQRAVAEEYRRKLEE